MEVNLVAEGLKFMVLGMGIVFLFLLLMILILELQGRIITKYFPEKDEPKKPTSPKVTDNTKTIAAITAAIQHHKNSKG